ncbi:MAG: alpha/beta hydrolase [Gemmatimonadetes bacterium]|nr:alpha/beta hydrolase [Gemmatimonadota bacterium]
MRGEFVDIRGTRVYYYAAGTRGGGDPIVLLHGFPGSSHSWRLLAPLLPEGRRLVIPDLLGCGRSDPPPVAVHAEAMVAAQVATLIGVLDELNVGRAAMIGHGLGGALALRIACTDPDRVSALATFATGPNGSRPRNIARLAGAAAPLAHLVGAPLISSFLHGSAVRGFAVREVGLRSLDVTLRSYGSAGTALGVVSLRHHLTILRYACCTPDAAALSRLRIPTTVLGSALDPFVAPAEIARLRAEIPGATGVSISDAGHFAVEDSPERCAAAVAAVLSVG